MDQIEMYTALEVILGGDNLSLNFRFAPKALEGIGELLDLEEKGLVELNDAGAALLAVVVINEKWGTPAPCAEPGQERDIALALKDKSPSTLNRFVEVMAKYCELIATV